MIDRNWRPSIRHDSITTGGGCGFAGELFRVDHGHAILGEERQFTIPWVMLQLSVE
jgi:hypothetical protein